MVPMRRDLLAAAVPVGVAATMLVAATAGAAVAGAAAADSPRAVREGPDWFTLNLGSPRDMSRESQVLWVEHLRTPPSVNGQLRADVGSDGKLFLLDPGHGPGAMSESDFGAVHPIDAGRYRRLAFRVSVGTQARFAWYGYPNGFAEVPDVVAQGTLTAGWRTYVLGLSDAWQGLEQGLALVLPDGAPDLRLDWVRLLPEQDTSFVTVTWAPEGRPAVDLLADDDLDPTNGYAAEVGADLVDSGQASWSPDTLPPGTYHVYVTPGGGSATGGSYSPDSVRVEPIPILTFDSPSPLSGDDYAAAVLGDAWDMDGPDDIYSSATFPWTWRDFTAAPLFQGGLLLAANRGSDSYFFLNVDPNRRIDTARYHYLSWRWQVEAPLLDSPERLDDTNGLITRFLYYGSWPLGEASLNTSNDVIIWDGWNTYTVDLTGSHLDDQSPGRGPGWTGTKTALRFDPVEGSRSFQFKIDWIRLTADPVARQGTSFPLRWSLRVGDRPFRLAFYIDTDRDWSNGTAGRIADSGAPPIGLPQGGARLYLPFVGVDRATHGLAWQVPLGLTGRFYLAAEVSDGLSTAVWYSDAPLVVEP